MNNNQKRAIEFLEYLKEQYETNDQLSDTPVGKLMVMASSHLFTDYTATTHTKVKNFIENITVSKL